MAKFGQFKFSESQFGTKYSTSRIRNRMLRTLVLGLEIRKDFGKQVIYRVRAGRNFYGVALGYPLQDKYKYVVPSSINNPEGEPWRRQLIAAVHKWKYDLSPAQKKAYNARVTSGMHMSGYNLFIREAMKGLVDMFVDRGDPADYDFEIGDFTQDDAWHTLSLAALITLGAKLILFDFDYRNIAANRHIVLRKNGQSNNINHAQVHTRVAAQDDHAMMVVAPDANRVIEYKVSTAGWAHINASVRGWWT